MFGLDTTETIFSLAIAIIYPFFFSKLTTKVTDYDTVNKMCDDFDPSIRYGYSGDFYFMNDTSTFRRTGFNVSDNDSSRKSQSQSQSESPEKIAKREEYKKCEKDRLVKLDQVNFNQHIMLIIVAFLGILGSSAIQTHSTKLGVGLGGVFTLILALFMYWHKYQENAKLVILGMSLISLLYLSVKLYKMESIADIFSLVEFGSK
jgi:hypothetical protein